MKKIMELFEKKCIPCEGGIAKLTKTQINKFNSQLRESWMIIDKIKIAKEFHFKNYPETIKFVNKVAEIAENEGHHPVLLVSFSKVEVYLWTHSILGLTENDFILASKIDEIYP
jgi:4a-hydroxytetrahydrobiopterin dehydratase